MFLLSITTIKKKLLAFFYVQLFVSLISLPILLCWGLPLSSMTIVGNFLFTPFLIFFLLLCTLFLTTELLGIPNIFIANSLEYFSMVWARCLYCGSPSWLMYCAQPHYLVLLVIVIAAFAIVQLRTTTITIQVGLLMLLAGISGVYLWLLCPPTSYHARMPCTNGDIFIIHHNKQTTVIDPGCIASNNSLSTWIEHTLLKELTKHLGTTTIHHFILLQPSARTFEAIAHMCELTSVERVYVPLWRERSEKKLQPSFIHMKQALESNGGNLVRIRKTMTISLDDTSYITITPQETLVSAGTLSYPALHVHGCVGGKNITTASIKSFGKMFSGKANNKAFTSSVIPF